MNKRFSLLSKAPHKEFDRKTEDHVIHGPQTMNTQALHCYT
jgi:hypothetical protein